MGNYLTIKRLSDSPGSSATYRFYGSLFEVHSKDPLIIQVSEELDWILQGGNGVPKVIYGLKLFNLAGDIAIHVLDKDTIPSSGTHSRNERGILELILIPLYEALGRDEDINILKTYL
jgi:hypothetical protein